MRDLVKIGLEALRRDYLLEADRKEKARKKRAWRGAKALYYELRAKTGRK